MTSSITAFVERNKEKAHTHQALPLFSDLPSLGLDKPHAAIVTCVDPRCNPGDFVGFEGPEAVIFRTVAGHVAPVLKDLAALDVAIGLNEIMIIHHTDCGATHFTDEGVRDVLKQRGTENIDVDGISFGAITNLEKSVQQNLATLRQSPLIRASLTEASRGFVFDIKTGLLTEV